MPKDKDITFKINALTDTTEWTDEVVFIVFGEDDPASLPPAILEQIERHKRSLL